MGPLEGAMASLKSMRDGVGCCTLLLHLLVDLRHHFGGVSCGQCAGRLDRPAAAATVGHTTAANQVDSASSQSGSSSSIVARQPRGEILHRS